MSPKTKLCGEDAVAGRLDKAEQFLEAAETIRQLADDEAEVGDAFVTLCVHAGIAAADVLCCISLGEHAYGENHQEAVALLSKVSPGGKDLSKALNTLLGMKTRAGYGATPVNADSRKRAARAAKRLVDAARERRSA